MICVRADAGILLRRSTESVGDRERHFEGLSAPPTKLLDRPTDAVGARQKIKAVDRPRNRKFGKLGKLGRLGRSKIIGKTAGTRPKNWKRTLYQGYRGNQLPRICGLRSGVYFRRIAHFLDATSAHHDQPVGHVLDH